MLIRQEELQRQDERDEILLQEELQAIEIELRRQRQRMQKSKKNGQKYQFANIPPLAKPKQHWKKAWVRVRSILFTMNNFHTIHTRPYFWLDAYFEPCKVQMYRM